MSVIEFPNRPSRRVLHADEIAWLQKWQESTEELVARGLGKTRAKREVQIIAEELQRRFTEMGDDDGEQARHLCRAALAKAVALLPEPQRSISEEKLKEAGLLA